MVDNTQIVIVVIFISMALLASGIYFLGVFLKKILGINSFVLVKRKSLDQGYFVDQAFLYGAASVVLLFFSITIIIFPLVFSHITIDNLAKTVYGNNKVSCSSLYGNSLICYLPTDVIRIGVMGEDVPYTLKFLLLASGLFVLLSAYRSFKKAEDVVSL